MRPPECIGCPLNDRGIGFVPVHGRSSLAICGEAPGHEESVHGVPFWPQAAAGSLLARAIRELGYTRDMFRVLNVVQCRPPNNELVGTLWEQDAISHCEVHRSRYLEGCERVLALGDTAARCLAKMYGSLPSLSMDKLVGFVIEGRYCGTIVCYHPAYMRRGNMELFPLLKLCLRRLVEGCRTRLRHDFITNPSLDDVISFVRRVESSPRLPLACDTETVTSVYLTEDERELLNETLQTIQFSLDEHSAIRIKFTLENLPFIKKILASPNLKLGHNIWFYDVPQLKRHGITEIGGHIHDTMYMFKSVHPELPRGLQSVAAWYDWPFPWKHLAGTELYDCYDVQSIQYIYPRLVAEMKQRGVLGRISDHITGYVGQVYRMHPIFESMVDRGLPVSRERLGELRSRLQEEAQKLNDRMQDLVPVEIRDMSPRRKAKDGTVSYGYIRPPKEISGLSEEDALRLGYRLVEFSDGARWVKVKPFVPSKNQVVRYLKWMEHTHGKRSGYRVPLNYDGAETTGRRDLELIASSTGDELLRLILEYRSITKTIANDLKNWEPGPDGRVHSRIRYTPPTGQLVASQPNILNAAKHTAVGQAFRRVIEAPEGYWFVEFDYERFHVVTMGWAANDPDYIRFGKLDCHSIFTSYVYPDVQDIDLSWSEDEIQQAVREYRKIPEFERLRNTQCKHTVLANNNGAGPRKLWYMTRPGIPTIARAEELQRILAERFPRTEQFKKAVTIQAHRDGYLLNIWGYLREFSDVYVAKWNKHICAWRHAPGSQYNEAISFHVQATAFGLLKQKLYEMDKMGILEKHGFVNTIHDSYVFLTRDPEACVEEVSAILSRPCTLLTNDAAPGGLTVGFEISCGRNLAGRSEDNPQGLAKWK